jgi:hypothetical protein
MKNSVLSQPNFQISVQQFFKGVSWSGQLSPAMSEGATGSDGTIPTFHPTAEGTNIDSLDLMQSVRGFIANIPWTGAVAQPMVAQTANTLANPSSEAPANLDAFSDFF